MTTERRADENKALRELVDALNEYVAARDSLWTLGFFDRIFRFGRCVDMLNQYDTARGKMRNSVQAVMAATAKTARDTGEQEAAPSTSPRLVTLEEFEMLLGKPAILRNRPEQNLELS